MSKHSLKIYTAMLFAMLFWGYSFIWSTQALQYYTPFTVVLFRLLLSTSLLLLLNFWLKRIQKINRKDLKTLVLLSFFQPFLYFVGENYGLTLVSTTATAVIISIIPLIAPFAAFIFLKEKISTMNIIGILISIFGILLVILKDDLSFSASPLGILFLLLAVLSAVAYSVVIVRLSGKYNVYTIITYQNTIGIIWFLIPFLIFDLDSFIATGFVTKPVLSIIQLSIFGSTLAFMFFTFGIKNLGITRANIFANVIPVFTAFFSFLVLDEILSFLNITGIFIVISGVMLTQLTKKNIYKFRNFMGLPLKEK